MTLAPDDTGSRPGRPLPGLGGWARRSDVEQVRLYTVASLHTVAWLLLATGVVAANAALGPLPSLVALVLAALLLGGLVARATTRATADVSRRLGVRDLGASLGGVVAVTLALLGWGLVLGGTEGAAVVMLGLGALGWVSGALADSRAPAVAVVVAVLASYAVAGSVVTAAYGGFVAGFFAFTVASSLWLLRIVTELDRARGTQASLAVAEERLRFSRDVHDVLGRHLSTIAVQSELAATLARRGDARTGDKILEVRATAHDALREARELARGYRPLDLGQELDGAVSLLRSAGIAASADLDGLPAAWHEPVARVVREAVTNVLRHSDAGRVSIGFADDVVSIDDDGTPRPEGGADDGSGLRTLAEELSPMGARLEASAHDDGFRVRLDLSAAVHPRPGHTVEVGG